MRGEKTIQGLAGAAGYLCSAYDELLAAGYDEWSRELRQLIDIIGAEVACLQESATNIALVRPQSSPSP